MDGISGLARPERSSSPSPSPLLLPLSRPQSMKVQMGGNDVALFTFFFHTYARRRDENPVSESPRGGWRTHGRLSFLPLPSFLIYTPSVPVLVLPGQRNFWILISLKLLPPFLLLLLLEVYLYSTVIGAGRGGGRELGHPRNVPNVRNIVTYVSSGREKFRAPINAIKNPFIYI